RSDSDRPSPPPSAPQPAASLEPFFMRVMRTPAISAAFVASLAIVAVSQESVDLAVVDHIKSEAFSRSVVMEHLRGLTDLDGPRLTGSPGFEGAAKRFSVEMIAPRYAQLAAAPLAWSAPTASPVTGEPLLAPIDVSFMRGP